MSLSNTEVVTVAADITQRADLAGIVGAAGSCIDGLAATGALDAEFESSMFPRLAMFPLIRS
jgi:hypothetical protein